MRRLREFWVGETDLAPLGLFRILYGVQLFNWIWQLYPNLAEFFTDQGFMPRAWLLVNYPDRFSILNVFAQWWQVAIVWALSLVVAVMVTVGYRTRLACALAFVVVASFEMRNPFILDGSDLVFRAVPFWLFFTAAGAKYSVDAALRRARGEQLSGRGPAFPVRILELQFAWIYLATGVEKLAGSRWLDGTAAYYALNLKYTFSRPWAEPFANNAFFVRLVTWQTLAVELLFAPLAFLPFLQPFARLLAVAGAAMLHLGILTLMNVGNFPIIMLSALVLFIPAAWVARLVNRSRWFFDESPKRLAYDGACAVCRRTAAFISAADIYRTVEVHDVRDAASKKDARDKRITVVDARGRRTHGAGAILAVARGIPLLAPFGALALIPGVGGALARLHGLFAARGLLEIECPGGPCPAHEPAARPAPASRPDRAPRARSARHKLAGYAALSVVALLIFATATPKAVGYETPAPAQRFIFFANVDQKWDMFSPDPASTDWWMWAPARLIDGTTFDLYNGRQPTNTPRYSDPLYSRWTKVHERIGAATHSAYRLEYGRMFCRLRNLHLREGEIPLDTFEVRLAERIIRPPGETPLVREHLLHSHKC